MDSFEEDSELAKALENCLLTAEQIKGILLSLYHKYSNAYLENRYGIKLVDLYELQKMELLKVRILPDKCIYLTEKGIAFVKGYKNEN